MFSKIKKLFSNQPVDNRTDEVKEFMEITKQIKKRLFCLKEYGEGRYSVKINKLFRRYSNVPYDGYCGYFEEFNDKRAILEILSLIYSNKENSNANDWHNFLKIMSDKPIVSFSDFNTIYQGDTRATSYHLMSLEDLKISSEYPVDIERFIEMIEAGEHLKFQ